MIPDHELLRAIGRGSYGEVWLARNIMGAWRAVKIVSRDRFDSSRPYEREFAGIEKFEPVSRSHESQMDILHVGRDDAAGYFYYVMELADDLQRGQAIAPESYAPHTLRAELEARGRLPARECLDLGIALATALEHLHGHGLIHRDVKPSNVIFINGRPKLADIGLVAARDQTMSFVGTEGYVPPEGPGSERGDLFALGKVLYETHTGLDCASFPDQPTALIPGDEPLLARELNLIILKACAPEAGRRQASLTALREEMEILKTGRSVERLWRAEEERAAAVERVTVLRRRLRRGAALSAIAAAAVVLAAWAWQQQRDAASERARAARAREHLGAMLDLNTGPLREKLERLGKLSLLRDVNEAVARSFDAEEKELLFLALQARFLKNHSRVLAALGQSTEAIAAARQASTLLARLAASERDEPRWPRELAETEALRAEYLSAKGRPDQAQTAARAGLARLDALAPRTLRAALLRRLGGAQAGAHDRAAAMQTIGAAIAELGEGAPRDDEWRRELFLAHQQLGTVQLAAGETAPALASFRRAASILDDATTARAGGMPWELERLTIGTSIGEATEAEGGRAQREGRAADAARAFAEALATFRHGHELAAALAARDADNVLWKREHAISAGRLARALQERLDTPERFDEALPLLRDYQRLTRELTDLDPDIERWQWDLASSRLEMGDYFDRRDDPAAALPEFLASLDVMDRFAASPDTPAERPYGLTTILLHASEALHKQDRRNKERALLTHWRARALAAAAVNPAWHFTVAACEHSLAQIALDAGDLAGALAGHRAGFAALAALFASVSHELRPAADFGWRERHAKLCIRAAEKLKAENRADDARRFATEARRAIFETGGYPAPDFPQPEREALDALAAR